MNITVINFRKPINRRTVLRRRNSRLICCLCTFDFFEMKNKTTTFYKWMAIDEGKRKWKRTAAWNSWSNLGKIWNCPKWMHTTHCFVWENAHWVLVVNIWMMIAASVCKMSIFHADNLWRVPIRTHARTVALIRSLIRSAVEMVNLSIDAYWWPVMKSVMPGER